MTLLPADRMATALSNTGTNPLVCPPAVDYPLSEPRMLLRLLGLVWALALAIDVFWLFAAPADDWRPWAGLLVTFCAGAVAWRCGPLTQAGVLVWDGAAWFWERPALRLQGQPGVRLDVQSGMLVHFLSDTGATCWMWLDQTSRPDAWLALRRAAHAAAGRAAVTPAAEERAAHP